MSVLVPNFPGLAKNNCPPVGGNCGCDIDFGDIFSEDALYKLTQEDSLCDAYLKINANFKMLVEGYLALAQVVRQKNNVTFVSEKPVSYEGGLVFNVADQRLYVWNTTDECYIPAYGCHSQLTHDTLGVETDPAEFDLPSLEDLRELADGTMGGANNARRGVMLVTFAANTPSCAVGLFVFNTSTQTLMVWSPSDNKYVPAFRTTSGAGATTQGPVYDTVVYGE